MFIIELTVGDESTIESYAAGKATRYKHLLRDKEITGSCNQVNFVNHVMNDPHPNVLSNKDFFAMLKTFGVDSPTTRYIVLTLRVQALGT